MRDRFQVTRYRCEDTGWMWALALFALIACGPDLAPGPGARGLVARRPETRTLPAGTLVVVRFGESLSSHESQPGEVFRVRVENDLASRGRLVVPRGSTVVGAVVEAHAPERRGSEARLELDFHLLELPTGEAVQVRAALHEAMEPGPEALDGFALVESGGAPVRIAAGSVKTLELIEEVEITLPRERIAGRSRNAR